MLRTILFVCLSLYVVLAKHEEYDGSALFEVRVQNLQQVQQLNELESQFVDVWDDATPNNPGQMLVNKEMKELFEEALVARGIEYKVLSDNIRESTRESFEQNICQAEGIEAISVLVNDPSEQINSDVPHVLTTPQSSPQELFKQIVVQAHVHNTEVSRWKNVLVEDDPCERTSSVVIPNQADWDIIQSDVDFARYTPISQILLEEQMLAPAKARSNSTGPSLSFTTIHEYDVVDKYLVELGERFPDIVTVVSAGTSVEGRDIKYLKISTTNFQDNSKPIVYMQSLLHAREWATLPATLYAIKKLVIDVVEQDLLEEIDWIILPIANPDGYVHTHESSRFWKKNRAPGLLCAGVDLNRNFDIFWSTVSSNIACSNTFHGRAPFSEPETAAVRDIIAQYGNRIELFLDIHSFGSMILYGYGNGELPANSLAVDVLGVSMAQAIDDAKWNSKHDYIVGNSFSVLYATSGSAGDYAMGMGVPYSYTFVLPVGSGNGFSLRGFLVSPDFIEQVGIETWEGIKVGARQSIDSYRRRRGL